MLSLSLRAELASETATLRARQNTWRKKSLGGKDLSSNSIVESRGILFTPKRNRRDTIMQGNGIECRDNKSYVGDGSILRDVYDV